MDGEILFWYSIWRLIAVAFCVLAVTVGACTSHNSYRISQLVHAGATPNAAHCAIHGARANEGVCQLEAIKAGK